MRTRLKYLFLALLFMSSALAQWDSPDAVEKTRQLNQSQANQAAQNNDQQQQQQMLYQQQQQNYQAQKQAYQDQSSRYLAERERYAAARAAYHRAIWPSRYRKLGFVDSDDLLGARVMTYSGNTIGRVEDLARVSGRVEAVRVRFSDGDRYVWIDRDDLKFDTHKRILVTDLARRDIKTMAAEQY